MKKQYQTPKSEKVIFDPLMVQFGVEGPMSIAEGNSGTSGEVD